MNERPIIDTNMCHSSSSSFPIVLSSNVTAFLHSEDGIVYTSPNASHVNKTDAMARAYGPGEPCEAKAGKKGYESVCLTMAKSKNGGNRVHLVLHFAILEHVPTGTAGIDAGGTVGAEGRPLIQRRGLWSVKFNRKIVHAAVSSGKLAGAVSSHGSIFTDNDFQ